MFFEERVLTLKPGLYRIWKMNKRKLSRLVGEVGNFEMALDLFEHLIEPKIYIYMTRTAAGKTSFVLNALGTRRSRKDHRVAVKRLVT